MRKLLLTIILATLFFGCKNDADDNNITPTPTPTEPTISSELVSFQNVDDSYFASITETTVYTRNSGTSGIQGTWIYRRYEDSFDFTTGTTRPVKVNQKTYTFGNPNWSFIESFTPVGGTPRTESTLGKYSLEKSGTDFILTESFNTGTTIKYKLYVSDTYMTLDRIN